LSQKRGILGNIGHYGKGKVFIGTLRGDNSLRRKEVIEFE
jgi:hypothetical protein